MSTLFLKICILQKNQENVTFPSEFVSLEIQFVLGQKDQKEQETNFKVKA